MVGLTDIADLERYVEIRNTKVKVVGIGADGLAVMIDRFPAFRRMMADQGAEFELDDLKKLGPELLCAGIAAGLGCPGDPAQEAKAAKLTLGEQMELVTAILDVTFPKGLPHFANSLRAFGVSGAAVSGDTGRGVDTKLPSWLNGSSQTDTPEPGSTPPDNSRDTPSSSPAVN